MSTPKMPEKKASKHGPEKVIKDERRAYEHLSRVQSLHKHLDKDAASHVTKLTDLARHELEAGHMKDAADLLRAAEHLSFGSLHEKKKLDSHPKLAEEFEHEFDEKLRKAEEHWSDHDVHDESLEQIYSGAKERAHRLFDQGSFSAALELARGAEALAHVKTHDTEEDENV